MLFFRLEKSSPRTRGRAAPRRVAVEPEFIAELARVGRVVEREAYLFSKYRVVHSPNSGQCRISRYVVFQFLHV